MKKKIIFSYSLTPEWQYPLVQQMGGQLIDNKKHIMPEALGKGHILFTQISPGISAVLMDFVLTTPIMFNKLESKKELYVFHYDLSEHQNIIKIGNVEYKIGSANENNFSLAILSSQIETAFEPKIGKRTLVLRLLVDKDLLSGYIKDNPLEEYTNKKIILEKNTLYYYDNIDSNSLLLIKPFKDQSIDTPTYETHLRGVSLRLLANFLDRYSDSGVEKNEITNAENEAIIKTKIYILDNLYEPFPSLPFLASLARMSIAKYIIVFKKQIGYTPHDFFTREKMFLINNLLQSGNYNTITDIMNDVNFTKLSYFNTKYQDFFNRKPSEDFVKKLV